MRRLLILGGPATAQRAVLGDGEPMAHIVEFRSNAVRAEPETEAAQGGGGAQIIIFPGVRIERHAEPPEPAELPAKSRRRKRDRLELPD